MQLPTVLIGMHAYNDSKVGSLTTHDVVPAREYLNAPLVLDAEVAVLTGSTESLLLTQNVKESSFPFIMEDLDNRNNLYRLLA